MNNSNSPHTHMWQDRYTTKILGKSYSILAGSILLLIMVLAVLLRIASAIYQGNWVTNLPGIYDQISYDGLARRIVDGYGFSFADNHWPATRAGEPTAHWSYLYTLYLAFIYKVFGPYPIAARVVQALVAGVFQTILLWRVGTRLFNRTVGLVSATLSAGYVYFFYYAGALITETFYILSILWVIDCSLRLAAAARDSVTAKHNSIHWWLWVEIGLSIGVTVLLRQVFLLFLPFLFLWLWWNIPDGDEGISKLRFLHLSAIKGLILGTLVLVLMIVPFTIRNYRAFGTFVLLNTNAGYAFFWGNHPVHGTKFMPLLSGGAQQYHDLIPDELLPLNEAELDKSLLKIGVQYVLDDPGRFILLSISRLKEYFKFWPSSDSSFVSNISRVGSFGISLPFMIYGLWLTIIQNWKKRTLENRSDISLILIFAVVYTSVHLLSWTLIRYRLPVDSVLIIFTALGITTIFEKYQHSKVKAAVHV